MCDTIARKKDYLKFGRKSEFIFVRAVAEIPIPNILKLI